MKEHLIALAIVIVILGLCIGFSIWFTDLILATNLPDWAKVMLLR